MATPEHNQLIVAGERLGRTVRYSREDIAEFARISFDANPLHHDKIAAQRARFGEVIASGQQTAAALMGLLATYFSRSDDGVARQMLCLNMNFSFKSPVFADQDLALEWRVTSVEWSHRLKGMLGHMDGGAGVLRSRPAVIARGTILVMDASLPA
ncbi:hypothetical protein BH11PSE8_BH11PSE8_35150 [soil metagenome]